MAAISLAKEWVSVGLFSLTFCTTSFAPVLDSEALGSTIDRLPDSATIRNSLPGVPQTFEVVPVKKSFRWCGARSLWALTRAYGFDTSFESLKSQCDSAARPDGTVDLSTLEEVAHSVGLNTLLVKCDTEWLREVDVPAITVHTTELIDDQIGGELMHARVFCGFVGGKFEVLDPFHPHRRHSLSAPDFAHDWTGYALLCMPPDKAVPVPANLSRAIFEALVVDGLLVLGFAVLLHCGQRRSVGLLILLSITCCSCAPKDEVDSSIGKLKANSLVTFDHPEIRLAAEDVIRCFSNSTGHGACSFSFVNISSAPIRIVAVESGCSCTVAEFPNVEIESGGRESITLNFDLTGRVGEFATAARVHVKSTVENFLSPESHVLRLTAFIVPEPYVVPSLLSFPKTCAGRSNTINAVLRIPLLPAESPPNVSTTSSSPLFSFRFTSPVPSIVRYNDFLAAEFPIEAKYTPKDAGEVHRGDFLLQFSGRREPIRLATRGFASHPILEVEPHTAIIRMEGDGANKTTAVLHFLDGSMHSIEITEVRPADLPVEVEFTGSLSPQGSELVFRMPPGTDNPRSFNGTVVLRVRDRPGTPVYVLPFVGYSIGRQL